MRPVEIALVNAIQDYYLDRFVAVRGLRMPEDYFRQTYDDVQNAFGDVNAILISAETRAWTKWLGL